ncbi:hypothetical protein [Aquimarina algiphila]|uniref:hypothetical protein n=1 Tax=Aquimarina algiphila TaxID=2047982 RepID=UPI00232DD60B|nr:hypothetical protein [Aquimarina algiphila]
MQTTSNNTVNRTVKPYDDKIEIQTQALQIYNIMPKGSRELAAIKYGCARWYLKNLITDIKTDTSKVLSIVKILAEASNEHTNDVIRTNKDLQQMANDFNTRIEFKKELND